MQADPHIQAPNNSQNYNRYSYVLNNPMSYTDPSGYFFKSLFKGIKKYWRQIASIAVMFIPGINVIAAGFISGYIATGSLKGAIVGAFTAGMAGPATSLGGFVTNGIVGGLASKAMGGKFGHGFWSAGIGASLGGQINGIKTAVGRVVASAVVGGTISKLTGGKFANGAFGAAFARTLGEARAGNLGSSKSGPSDDNTFADSNREALDGELAELNVKAKEHGLFTGKNSELDAAKWLNENGGHIQDKYGAEIGANIYENSGGHSIGKIVTSYHSNFVDLSGSLNMFPHKFGQVADWHTHSNGSHYASWGTDRDSHKSYYRAYVSSVSNGVTSMSLYNPAIARSTWPITRQSYESALTCVVGGC